MRRFVTFICLWLLTAASVSGQTPGMAQPLCSDCKGDMFVRFESTSFVKNNEYDNAFTKGFTGIGFMASPSLEYYPTETTRVRAGIYLLKYAGLDRFSRSIPLFSVHQQLNNTTDLVLGSLYGALEHGLEEPLFRTDRFYQDPLEYGLQLLHHSAAFSADLWLNWEQFILPDDPYQEAFQAGLSSQYTISSGSLEVAVPLQVLLYHKGGQIDSSEEGVLSQLNAMSGLRLDYQMPDGATLGIEPLFFYYKGLNVPDTGSHVQPFSSGKAVYVKCLYQKENLKAMLGYWQADQFIAPKGEFLFQSVSESAPSYHEADRKLITGKIGFVHPIKESIQISFSTAGYYDLVNEDLSYACGLQLVLNESFFISHHKKHRKS